MLSDKETYWQLKHFNETILIKISNLEYESSVTLVKYYPWPLILWIICDTLSQLSVTVIKNYLWFLFLINDVNHLNILSWIICEVHQVFIVTFNIANYLWLFSWIICEWYSASYMSGTKNKCNCHHELSLC